MSVLDQPDHWASIDPRSMRSLVESFPFQVETAAAAARTMSLAAPRKPGNIVVTGLGGSAIGDLLIRLRWFLHVAIREILRKHSVPTRRRVRQGRRLFALRRGGN